MTTPDTNPLDNEQEQPKAPQPDDIVLINAEDTLGWLVRELQNLSRRLATLEGQRMLHTHLIDRLNERVETLEGKRSVQPVGQA